MNKDELIQLLNHCKQGVLFFTPTLELHFMNEKAQKLLESQSKEVAMHQLHKLIILGLEQGQKLSVEHKEILLRTSQKNLLSKADSKMIETLIASAEKKLRKVDSFCDKTSDQLLIRIKSNKKIFSLNDFRQLFLSFFPDNKKASLLECQQEFLKANKLKVCLDQSNDKIIEINFCKLTHMFHFLGYVIYINNITENEKLQQFIQKFQFQTLHFNSFSHELRTPLNCSLNLLQALKTQLPQQNLLLNYLNPAIVSNKLLMHQINDILDYASFGLGTFQLNIRGFYIKDIFQQLSNYYSEICNTKGIKLQFRIKDNLNSHQIFNDQERIIQVLVNLINNSLKFTMNNDNILITSQLKLKSVPDKQNYIKFIVRDTGRGVSKEELKTINDIINMNVSFEGNIHSYLKNLTNKYLGLGFTIGSRMSKELAFSNKSYFKIRSLENNYFKVSFRVLNQNQLIQNNNQKELSIQIDPVVENNFDDQNDILITSEFDTHQIPMQTTTFFSNKCILNNPISSILLCDDVAFNLLSLKLLIKNLGYESDIVYDGQSAISQVSKRIKNGTPQYKLVFMDIEMPGLNGYETSIQLLKLDTRLNIIMCSAYDTQENLNKAQECGMKDYITKPVRIELLRLIMAKYFQ